MHATVSWLQLVAMLIATFYVALTAVWGAFALWYQLPGDKPSKLSGIVLWSAFSVITIGVLWQGRVAVGFGMFLLAHGGMLLWWTRIAPSHEGLWADDVARITTGTIKGTRVTLTDVRNFDWRTKTDYTQRWETRSYDLGGLRSVDMIMSNWGLPAISHMLISFGFEADAYVTFSVEIRRQTFQAFSEIGGFFKEFELCILAADERDAIRLRTNVRGEEAWLYQLRMPREAMRLLFLGYVAQANELAKTPRFYHTITVNCTTLVYQMMNRIVGGLPLDYRLLLSGHIAGYVYRVKGLNQSFSLEELRTLGRITERARLADQSPHFSTDIRAGLPGAGLPA